MEYPSMRRSPRQIPLPSLVEDENHSFFCFPDVLGVAKKTEVDDRERHPYPTSISIQNLSPTSKQYDSRSPLTTPVRINKETRQTFSPPKKDTLISSSTKYDSELSKHHNHGLIHFNSNRLSEAVDSYSHAIRIGLDDLIHHKEMASRLMTSKRDDMIFELGSSLAQVHIDMGQCLEVAQKYTEAKAEYENGMGMLQHTCMVSKDDKRLKLLNSSMKRMERAESVESERERQSTSLQKAFKKLKQASTSIEQDKLRRGVIASLKKSLRLERDSLGENSYAFAKIKLKLAKTKCEGGDIEGGLQDANHALATIKSLLRSRHTLVGAACLFVAAVYEKSAFMEYEKSKSKLFNIGAERDEDILLTPKCKNLITKALECYADAVEPLQFKRDNNISNQSQSNAHPELGDTYHKIAKLNVKKGSYTLAFEAMHHSLKAYGTSANAPRGSPSNTDLHPNAALVWQDIASLHLTSKEYSDAIYAAEKAVEFSRRVKKSFYSEKMDMVPVFAFQIAGDGYGGLHRLEDATMSYQKANSELMKIVNGGHYSSSIDVNVVGAEIIRKLGLSFYHRGINDDAKAMLMNALSTLRSKKDDGKNGNDEPSMLIDIGMVNIACGDYAEAMNVLRLCLKMFADLGVPDHCSDVIRARKLFTDAQRAMKQSGAISFEPMRETFLPTYASVEPQKKQFGISVYSTLDSSKKMPLFEGNSYEAIPHEKQLEELYNRITEVEKERDQEKKDRIFAAANHQKQMESITQSSRAILEAELESLRRKINKSEGSYQELVKFIDNEKAKSNEAHESKVRELQSEIRQLHDKMDSSGAIEYMRLSDELAAQRHEASVLNEQCQESSEAVKSMRKTNSTLQSEMRAAEIEVNVLKSKNDELHREIQHLSSELAATKLISSVNSLTSANDTNIKKIEFELQTERNRRQILETTLQKEFEKGGLGYGSGGGFGYHMPFGIPPMQMIDNNYVAKLKNLDIDLATERADKEMLEKALQEMRGTHEQEKNSMLSQYSSFVQLHEQETSNLLKQVGEKSTKVDVLNQELSNAIAENETTTYKLHDTMNQLSNVNEQLSRASLEISSLLKVKEQLKNTQRELLATKDDLHTIKVELRNLEKAVHQKEAEGSQLLSANERLKKEYGEAIAMFESEISCVSADKESIQLSLDNEIQRLKTELGSTKYQLQNALVKIEVLDSDHMVMRTKEEQLHQAQQEIIELTHDNKELEAALADLEEMVFIEKTARKETDTMHADVRGKLIASETVTEKLKEAVNNLQTEKKEIESQLSVSNKLGKQLDIALKSVVRQLEGLLPELELSASFPVDETDDENSARSPEYVRIHIAHLLQQICKSHNEVGKAHRELSKAKDDLRLLEAKHKAVKQELAEMGDLQNDYDELLDQYELLVEEKRVLDGYRDAENESLLVSKNEYNLLEARLEDAFENVQALEADRNTLQAEIRSVKEDIATKDGRIRALQADNQLIETLEKQALEYDAALLQKDEKMKILEGHLKSCGFLNIGSDTRLGMLTVHQHDHQDKLPLCISCAHAETNPFADDSSSDRGDHRPTTHPFDDDSSSDKRIIDWKQVAELQSRVLELERVNRSLDQQIDAMTLRSSEESAVRAFVAEEDEALKEEIRALMARNELLSAELSESNEESVIAAKIHENDGKAISCLQDALNRSKQLHEEELEVWMKRFYELQSSYVILREQLNRMNSEPGSDELEAQLTILNDRARYLENINSELTAKLADVQNKDEQYQCEISSWRSRVTELEESIDVLRLQGNEQSYDVYVPGELEDCRRRISSLEKDLQNALDYQEGRSIDHNLELARVSAEFHNAVVSLDELSKENKHLERDLDLLLAKETEDDEHFENERNAAHQRFESMEKALQERLSRIEREKERLEADFNDEMIKKDEENAQITIELCAWKLEVQNALNDIESLRRERDDLKAQVTSYVKSLEAACMGKAILDEKLHSLGVSGVRV